MKAYGMLGLCLVFSLSTFAQVEEMVVPHKFPVQQKTEESLPAQRPTESWEEKMVETQQSPGVVQSKSRKSKRHKKDISLSGCELQQSGSEILCADGRLFVLSGKTIQSTILEEHIEHPRAPKPIEGKSSSRQ